MKKIAQSHVEMILSFSLFAGVIIVLFIFINPFSKTEVKTMDIDEYFQIFLNEISVNAGKISVILNTNDDCYNRLTQFGNNFVEIQDSLNTRKYTLYFSDYFGIGSISCSSRIKRDYTLGVYSEEKVILYEKIAELKTLYESDYESLKQTLGILGDFSWNLKDLNGAEISQLSVSKNVPSGLNILAKEMPKIIIDKSGKFYEYTLNFKVW